MTLIVPRLGQIDIQKRHFLDASLMKYIKCIYHIYALYSHIHMSISKINKIINTIINVLH